MGEAPRFPWGFDGGRLAALASELRQVLFQDAHIQGIRDLPLIGVAVEHADKFSFNGDFDRSTALFRCGDPNIVIAEGGAQIGLYAGDFTRAHYAYKLSINEKAIPQKWAKPPGFPRGFDGGRYRD